jgi:monothiol glutaredoxin
MQSPFNILNNAGVSNEILPQNVEGTLKERIEKILNSEKVILFMKGNESMPQCGFSANSVAIVKSFGKKFNTFDILKDMDIRQGLKEYSNWPTYPQLYINGKLIGGNDIITELYQAGELKELFDAI